jgi:hypothetical protein
VAFLQSGGLERSRARELEQLREERKRLEQAQAAQARRSRDSEAGNPWGSSRWSAGDVFTLLDALKPD